MTNTHHAQTNSNDCIPALAGMHRWTAILALGWLLAAVNLVGQTTLIAHS